MKYLSLLIILFSIHSFSADYKSAVRLKEGDVISAEVFNDIMDRIELTLKPITQEELVGTWTVKQYICDDMVYYGHASFCNQSNRVSSTNDEGIVFKTRNDSVTISDNGDNTFNWTSPNINLLFNAIRSDTWNHNTGNLNHTCSINSAQIMGCTVDPSLLHNGNKIAVWMNVKRTSPSQLVLFWGPRIGGSFNHLILNKNNLAPNPPTALSVSLSGSSVSLTWTASEGGATSYTVKAKTSATGTYSNVITANTGTTYTDTLSSGTKWYRIFAVNSDGTSIGSNVVSVTAP